MHCLKRLLRLSSPQRWPQVPPSRALSTRSRPTTTTEDEWNDAWEAAWLPDDLSAENRAPWESDVHFPDSTDADPDAKAFVEEMDERWDERRMAAAKKSHVEGLADGRGDDLVTSRRNDGDEEYRLRKQQVHAALWMKEIEKMEESRLQTADTAGTAEIDRLLDSCAEIFDSGNDDLNNTKIPGTSDFKTKPDGWETTSKTPDGNIWEVTQREEDILLQEFERRIAFSKFQIASFIKTHIFSRRRPIDGWKYMIEELGPNARKGKGSVQRLPALSDPATQPFKEEHPAIGSNFTPFKG